MIDNDAFEARLVDEMREYASSARQQVDPGALAHAIALDHPRRRMSFAHIGPWRVLAWIVLAGLLFALVLGAATLGQRPMLVLPKSVASPPASAPAAPLGLVAFGRRGDIYLADETSGRVFKVDGPAGSLSLGAWSPDGRWLSFSTDSRVYLLDAWTLEVRDAPSPDPDVIASLPTPSDPTSQPGAPSAAPLPSGFTPLDPNAPFGYGTSGWLPTGASMILRAWGTSRPLAVDVSDGGTTDLHLEDLCHPAISPDGRYAAAIKATPLQEGGAGGNTGKIVLVDLATGSRTEIADFGGLGCGVSFGSDGPGWSPDSQRIAVVTTDSIQIIGLDGTEFARIGSHEYLSEVRPGWSPDGEWIAFVGRDGLEVARPDGTDRHTLVPGFRSNAYSWTPDSGHLEYGISLGSPDIEGAVMWSVDVTTGATGTLDVTRPWVLGFARQPVTVDTPTTTLP